MELLRLGNRNTLISLFKGDKVTITSLIATMRELPIGNMSKLIGLDT